MLAYASCTFMHSNRVFVVKSSQNWESLQAGHFMINADRSYDGCEEQ